jgi:hypothetical protein
MPIQIPKKGDLAMPGGQVKKAGGRPKPPKQGKPKRGKPRKKGKPKRKC